VGCSAVLSAERHGQRDRTSVRSAVVAEFLSAAWVAALDAAARSSDSLAACTDGERFVIEQRVLLGDGHEAVHHVRFADQTVGVLEGAADAPDVVLTTDLETATALARGDVTAQSALAEGRLLVRGRLDRLTRHGAALARLDDVFASVRRDTTYPA
jgi:hypothetical protein